MWWHCPSGFAGRIWQADRGRLKSGARWSSRGRQVGVMPPSTTARSITSDLRTHRVGLMTGQGSFASPRMRHNASRHVRFAPFATTIMRRRTMSRWANSGCERSQQIASYSITSSTRRRNDSGIGTPSAFAVMRLMTRSNLVGCSTGISSGFAPRRILSTWSAVRRNRSEKFGP
jgi:hypothetical protein